MDITSGNFVFSASESYLIEDGKLTRPVRNATLIGNGPEALKYVSMVGNDLQLDEGIGVCGKEGQSVPVGVGHPDHQDRPHDRGRHGLSDESLTELAADVVRQALDARRHRCRVHDRRRRRVLRQRAHGRGGEPERSRLARRRVCGS